MGPGQLGRYLLVVGALLALAGLLLVLSERLPFPRLGRLPGDLSFQKGAFRFYFPLATSLLLSALLTLFLWIVRRR
ncbi:MAG TPA: DUF2905 family protein [Anaeromyxobacteraceae bacterium]|nr:DUF2905 family protein [Anaeromyxobacteraceae bacterium]